MTKRERERKIKMFGMIGMSVLVISSLATATYAWFTKINVSASTGTMTVIAPDEYAFWSYKGNYTDPGHTPSGVFSNDFVEVTSSNKAAQTDFSSTGAYPGQSKIYCIVIADRNPDKPVSLLLNSFISNNTTKQGGGLLPRVDANNGKKAINIGQAIDITSFSSEDGTGYYDAVNEEGWLVDTNDDAPLTGDVFNPSVDTLNSGSYANPLVTPATPITIYADTSAQNAWESEYLFFRVCFADDTSTLYRETNLDAYNRPVTSGEREFVHDTTNGTSNCYSGLTFQLVNLTLNF